jgi:NTE family protein
MKNNVDIDRLREGVIFAGRGGGIRSCSAIGALRALEEENIPIKVICGESGSSIVAALYAYGYDAKDVLRLFLEYNETITKAAKIYGGRGAVVLEELIRKETNDAKFKDVRNDCYINACQGSFLKPKLYLFSNKDTPDETLGFASSASAGLPVFYGNSYKYQNGKKITLFDGGGLYNPYIPSDKDYPIVYSSFSNSINYQKYIPLLQKPVDVVNAMADIIINVPVGKTIVIGSNEVVKDLEETGYQLTKKILHR